MTERHDPPTIGQAVEDYYASIKPPDAKLRRLMKTRRSWAHGFWVASGLWAATAAMALLAVTIGYNGGRPGPVPPTHVAAQAPRLVAVQIHADWCPRSPAVEPIFADLLTRYGNEPILFVSLDITDEVRSGQARLLAKSLGISQAFDAPFGSGMIKLIDRQNDTLLASITGREDSTEFELRVAEFLDATRRGRNGSGT